MSVPPPAPADIYANKSIVSAVGFVILVGLRWGVSDEFQLNDEGVITLAGAITTLGVYAVSNFQRIVGVRRSSWGREGGYGIVELLIALILLVLLIWLVVALVPDADAQVVAFRSSWG